MTPRPMPANQNTQFDQIDASQHGIAENSEELYPAHFSHGLPTPRDDRDRSPVYEDEPFNLAPPDSESTGRVRERVTNEWVASTVARRINPSAISSPEEPSTKLPSTEVPELRQVTQKPHAPAGSQAKSRRKSKQDEVDLLRWSSSEEEDNDLIGGEETTKDEIQDAALFSQEILKSDDTDLQPQHALFGVNVMAKQMGSKKNVKLYQNTNIPNSVFICGLQGSGKSHTLSCLIGEYNTTHLTLSQS